MNGPLRCAFHPVFSCFRIMCGIGRKLHQPFEMQLKRPPVGARQGDVFALLVIKMIYKPPSPHL